MWGNEEENEGLENVFPVFELPTVKLILTMSIQRLWKMRRIDFQNEFSQGKLEKLVFAELLKHRYLDEGTESSVILLQGGLYGVRHVARIWKDLLTADFEKASMKPLKITVCLFHWKKIITARYVDHALVFAEEKSAIQCLKSRLSEILVLKDLGRLSQFLNIGLNWEKAGTVGYSQKSLADKLLENNKMEETKLSRSPMENGFDTPLYTTSLANEEATSYRSIVGRLF